MSTAAIERVHSWCAKCNGEIHVGESYYAITANKEVYENGQVYIKGSVLLNDYCLACAENMEDFVNVKDNMVVDKHFMAEDEVEAAAKKEIP